jgi:hypothetical protein
MGDLMSSRTSKARSTPHKPTCGCRACYFRARRAAGEGGAPDFPTIVDWRAAQVLQRVAGGDPDVCPECRAALLTGPHVPGCSRATRSAQAGAGATSTLDPQDQDDSAPRSLVDTAALFPNFRGPSFAAWRVFLRVLDGLPLDPEDLAIFQARTGRSRPPSTPPREVYVIVGRRGGKSLVASLIAVHHATKPRTWSLGPGEVAAVPIIAADREQAQVMLGYVKGLLAESPDLAPLVTAKTRQGVALANRTRISIHTASFRTTRGYTLAAAFADEVSFWRSEETSTNPDKAIMNALKPGLLTSGGPLIVISTPYSRRGVLWDSYKRHWGRDDDPILVWQGASRDMNPDLPEDVIAEAYESDPEAASAEYGGLFRSDLDSFISAELLARLVIPGRSELPRTGGHVAFVDPSGGSQDSMTLAIAHRDRTTGLVVLDLVREVVPPFSPEAVVVSFAEECTRYGVTKVTGDAYGGEWPREQFRKNGIAYAVSEPHKSEIYLSALPLMTSGRVELLDSTRLVNQLAALERRTGRTGRDTVDHPPRGRDDVANAACGALVLASGRGQSWHLPVFGYRTDGTETVLIGGSGGSAVPTDEYYETRCPGCGTSMTGTAAEILRRIRFHWSDDDFGKHRKNGPMPTTIEEVLRRAA